jgi:hypothetical protein
MNLSYSLGFITFYFYFNWMNQWYNILVLFMLIPLICLSIVCAILIQESPNYYLCKLGDNKSCI